MVQAAIAQGISTVHHNHHHHQQHHQRHRILHHHIVVNVLDGGRTRREKCRFVSYSNLCGCHQKLFHYNSLELLSAAAGGGGGDHWEALAVCRATVPG